MSGWLGWLVAFAAVFPVVGMGVVDALLVERRRRRVHAAVQRETARHVRELVPEQRQPTPRQGWWDFIPTQRDGEQ